MWDSLKCFGLQRTILGIVKKGIIQLGLYREEKIEGVCCGSVRTYVGHVQGNKYEILQGDRKQSCMLEE